MSSTFKQIFYLIKLKALLTMRSHGRDPLSIIQSIIFLIFVLIFAIALTAAIVGSLIFIEKYFNKLASTGLRIMFLANTLLGIYGLWLLVPAFGFRINESYDVTKLLHLPIRRVTLFIASVLGNFADLTVLIPLAVITGVLIIFTTSIPVFFFNLLTMIIFIINMFICGQLIVILLYNFLPRISLFKILLVIVIVFAIGFWGYIALKHTMRQTLTIFDIEFGMKVYIFFPHGMAASALWNASEDHWRGAAKGLGWLVLHTLILGAVTNAFFSKWYATGNVEGAPVGPQGRTRRAIAEMVAGFWARVLKPVLPPVALEVMRKDHLNLLRNRNFILYKTIPATIGPVLIIVSTWYNVNHLHFIQRDEGLPKYITYAAMFFAGFIVIAQAHLFAGNVFGLEGRGIFSLFTTEANKRDILIGKNAFLLTLYILDATVFGLLTWLLLRSFAIGAIAALTLMNLFVIMLSVGNFTSAVLPYYFDLDRPAVSASQVIVLAIAESLSAMMSLFLLLPVGALLLIPLWLHWYWLEIITIPLGLAYSFFWLCISVRFAGPLVERFERNIMLKVSEP